MGTDPVRLHLGNAWKPGSFLEKEAFSVRNQDTQRLRTFTPSYWPAPDKNAKGGRGEGGESGATHQDNAGKTLRPAAGNVAL